MIKYKEFLQILEESKLSDLKKKYGDKIVDHYSSKVSSNPAILTWLLKQHEQNKVKPEEHEELSSTLKGFEKYKKTPGVLPYNDINKYGDINDLRTAVHPRIQSTEKKKEEKEKSRNVISSGSEKIHEDPKTGGTVHRVHTTDASCELGKGTKWCVAASKSENAFNRYHNFGNFYVVNGKDHEGKPTKYGVHFEKGEFQDPENNHVGADEIVKNNPWIKNVHEFQHKHPAFTSEENLKKEEEMKKSEEPEKIVNDKSLHPNLRAKAIEHHSIVHNLYNNTPFMLSNPHLRTKTIKQHDRKISDDTLKKLINDKAEHPEVRETAAKFLVGKLHKEDFDKILNDKNESNRVKHTLLKHQGEHLDSRQADEIMNSKNPAHDFLKKAVMDVAPQHITKKHIDDIMNSPHGDESLKLEAMRSFGKHITRKHIHDALNNPNSSAAVKTIAIRHHGKHVNTEMLDKAAKEERDEDLDKEISEHPDVHPDTLHHIAENSDYKGAHYAIADNKNTRHDTLQRIAEKTNIPTIHEMIANHENVDPDTLHHIAEKSNKPNVHEAILNNPKVLEKTKKLLSKKNND